MSLVKAALRYAKSKKPTFGTADHDRCKVVTANSAQVVSMAGDVHSLKHLDAPLRCLNPALHNNKGEPAESLSRVPTDTASDWSLGSSLHPHKPKGASTSASVRRDREASTSASARPTVSASTSASVRRVLHRSSGAPIVAHKRVRGSWKFARSITGSKLNNALILLRHDKFAMRTRRSTRSRIKTWIRLTSDTCEQHLPLTSQMLEVGSARLKEARFVSAYQILYTARRWHIRNDWIWTNELKFCFSDCLRSVMRGIIESRKASEFDLIALSSSPISTNPIVPGGPVMPVNLTVVGTFWALREDEFSNLVMACASVNHVQRTASLTLLTQKCVRKHKSVPIEHGCANPTESMPCVLSQCCPVCALAERLLFLEDFYPRLLRRPLSNADRQCLPLFPSADGSQVSRIKNIDSLCHCLQSVGCSTRDPMGDTTICGHSFRRTAIRVFARAKIPITDIVAVTRHSLQTVLAYLNDLKPCTLSIAATVKVANMSGRLAVPLVSASAFVLDWRKATSYGAHAFVIDSDIASRSKKVHLVNNAEDTRVRCPVKILESATASKLHTVPQAFTKTQLCSKCFAGHAL